MASKRVDSSVLEEANALNMSDCERMDGVFLGRDVQRPFFPSTVVIDTMADVPQNFSFCFNFWKVCRGFRVLFESLLDEELQIEDWGPFKPSIPISRFRTACGRFRLPKLAVPSRKICEVNYLLLERSEVTRSDVLYALREFHRMESTLTGAGIGVSKKQSLAEMSALISERESESYRSVFTQNGSGWNTKP
jgi:hypothetical protein